jgi:hypothetical protein
MMDTNKIVTKFELWMPETRQKKFKQHRVGKSGICGGSVYAQNAPSPFSSHGKNSSLGRKKHRNSKTAHGQLHWPFIA